MTSQWVQVCLNKVYFTLAANVVYTLLFDALD